MRLQDKTPINLAQFAENLKTQLAGTEMSAINAAVRAELIAAIGDLPTILENKHAKAVELEGKTKAMFSSRNETFDEVLAHCRKGLNLLKANNAPKDQFAIGGYDYPYEPRGVYVAQIPDRIAVTGSSNGINRGRFKGNNNAQSVVYEIWRREGKEGKWALHFPTKKQSFEDHEVIPGHRYEYKVRAVAAKNQSEFSNVALVYGT